ncbi:MAG: gliding motility-associated C-terminal domain-containing protein [Sphingobacteriaceae bacterium]|nr:gliding motility-associated C-terminal domain-containing protein [Sphingobacteriaceae bacterium]
MKKILLVIFTLLLFAGTSKAQGVITNTVTWTSGWCNICGPQTGNYSCNPPWSGSGNWNNGTRTFVTNVPPGNIISGVCVTVNKVNCGYTNLCVVINGNTIQCLPPAGGNCACGSCWPQTFCNTYPCPTGLPNFVNQGTNTITLINVGTICVNSAVITLTYQTCCPTPTITVAGNTAICSGQSTSLTAAGAGIGGTYTWTAPGGTTLSTLPGVAVQPTATTIYTVYGTTPFPCTGSQTVEVQVNPTPTLTPGNDSPVCQGATVNLTVNAVPGGTLVTYLWQGPNSYTSAFQNPQITNIQPNMAGIYTVTAVNNFSNGGSCSSSANTTVNVIPVNQTSVTPQFTLCEGDALNLTAQNAVPPTAYYWTGPNTFTSNLQNPTIANTNTVHAGDYIVTASFAVQGLTLVCTSTAVSNVSVVATSPITLTIPQNICEGMTANISATANPMPLQFNWTGPNGYISTGSNTTIPNVVPAHTGVYNVVGVWAIGSKSCTISNFNQMNVVPVAPIAINVPTMVCYPADVHLTSSSQGAISYSWGATTGFTSNIPNPILGAPGTTATGIYTVFTAYTNGALICYNSNTTQVTVNPIIPVDLEPYKQLCYNATYSISGPPGATSYLWLGPNSYSSTNQLLVIPSIQPPLAGTYTLEVTLGPCKTLGTTKVDVLTPISFTNTPGNKTICMGDSIALYAGATGGSHNYAYVWNPQQWLGSPTGSVQYATPLGTTIYNLTAYDIACPFYTVGASFTVNVNKAPQPQLDLPKHEGCQPLCLTFNSKTQEQASQITYDFGNGNVMQADDFNYCLNDAGTYNLKIRTTGKNGCSYNWEYQTPIQVWPTPNSIVETNPERVTTTNNNVTFYPSSTSGNVVSYQWAFEGVKGNGAGYDTSFMKNPTRIYDNIGDYPVLLISTTDKGCIDTLMKVIEVRDEFAIFIPNTFTPNGDGLNDIFNIKGVGIKTTGYSMEIYDRWGTLVYSTKELTKGWDGTVKGLNAENGVYVFKVKAEAANGDGRKEYVGHVSLLK